MSDDAGETTELPSHAGKSDQEQLPLKQGVTDEWDKQAIQVVDVLTKGYLKGKRPLFVLGAGVSQAQVPMLRDMTENLLQKLQASALGDPLNLIRRGGRIVDGTGTREDAAEFFHLLQTTAQEPYQDIWRHFSEELLKDGLRTAKRKYGALSEAEPTNAHLIIARLLTAREAFCVSLNFDRLTQRAIHQQRAPAVILAEASQVRRYFTACRPSIAAAVTKIRGDVFYAHCSSSECPMHRPAIPLHRLRQTLNGLLCPECDRHTLRLALSFPSLQEKEADALKVLDELLSFVGHRLSAVVFLGLSGRWDRYLLDSLFSVVRDIDIPVVDVRPAGPDEYIRGFIGRYYPSLQCERISGSADAFMQYVDESLSIRNAKLRWSQPPECIPSLPPDVGMSVTSKWDSVIWFRGAKELQFKNNGKRATLDREHLANRLAITRTAQSTLGGLAQLDLKDLWMGLSPENHTRLHHCLGVAAVGLLWYDRLLLDDHREGAKRLLRTNSQVERTIFANALFYHDYGHMPFSHLLERALAEINWQTDADLTYGSEVQVLISRLSTNDSTAALKALAKIFLPGGIPGVAPTGVEAEHEMSLVKDIFVDLVSGRHGRTWLQCILNSPIDADKIDYMIRDQRYFSDAFPSVGSRMPYSEEHPTRSALLEEFLSAQEITPNGYIALHGRSATAAGELLRERCFLYEKFYFAPEMRVFERMAMEIVKQFAIHCIMAPTGSVWQELVANVGAELNTRESLMRGETIVDLRGEKRRLAQMILESMHQKTGGGFFKEAELLDAIWKRLAGSAFWDSEFSQFMSKIWSVLEPMMKPQGKPKWPAKAWQYVVGEPIFIDAARTEEVREQVRPVSHEFHSHVIVDIVRFPKVLGVGRFAFVPVPHSRGRPERLFAGFIVPEGRVEHWTTNSPASCPLMESAVAGMEQSKTMIIVIDPSGTRPPETTYAFDRIRSICDQFELRNISTRR